MIPTTEGFYWATTIRRNPSKRRPWAGQIGGLRWIVRVIDYGDGSPLRVQTFGDSCKPMEVRDYKDWDGPLGVPHMVEPYPPVPKENP